MCGRYTQTRSTRELIERFAVSASLLDQLAPRYNIAPSQPAPIVRMDNQQRVLAPMQWGFVPFWADDPQMGQRMINARAESAAEKPAYKAAFRRRRCLVPADGFFEWQKTSRGKRPMYVRVDGGELFGFAGLWDRWQSPDGSPLETFTILTTEANELLKPIHSRMPVIVPAEREAQWLDPGAEGPAAVEPILAPFPADRMSATPVSRRVNSPAHDDPSCIETVEQPTEGPTQRELFG